MNQFVKEEVSFITSKISCYKDFKDKTVLITGATGLIGSYLVRVLSYLNELYSLNINLIGVARNKEKVKQLEFDNKVNWLYSSLTDEILYEDEVDYIIHTASPTDSSFFVEKPVELINDTIDGLDKILRFSLKKKVKGFLFTSSLEVYGLCNEDKFLKENEYYSIDPNNVRNSYSEGKRILECLCSSYASEYKVPTRIVRLGQTFGPGVSLNDNRVFSQFARAVATNSDIVLSTKGETKRSYCSLIDAINGILIALLKGKDGEAYNLASDNSYCSIYELATNFIKNNNSKIVIKEENNNKYLATLKFGLDTSKIKNIGFVSSESINEAIPKFINYIKEENK